MSKLYNRLNSLCVFSKQEKKINDFNISHLKLDINEKSYYMTLIHYGWNSKMTKTIFEKYKDFFILLDETLDKSFTDKYKSFVDEYEEEHEKLKNELEKLGEKIL